MWKGCSECPEKSEKGSRESLIGKVKFEKKPSKLKDQAMRSQGRSISARENSKFEGPFFIQKKARRPVELHGVKAGRGWRCEREIGRGQGTDWVVLCRTL